MLSDDGQSVHQAHTGFAATPFFRILCCAAIFCIVAGARLSIIGAYGSDVPFWDQWDAEWHNLLRPYLAGTLQFSDLIAPHNEHRIFFTRILDLALFRINGQWDPRLEMTANALLYPLVACLIALPFSRNRGPLFCLAWTALLSAVFALPYAWENTLAGFQSQFYFLTGFSLLYIQLFSHCPLTAGRCLAGFTTGAAALFTMGSGFFAPLAVLAALLPAVYRRRNEQSGMLKTLIGPFLVSTVLVIAGIVLSVQVPEHAQYRAHSPSHFLSAAASLLSWPWSAQKSWFVVSWLPFSLYLTAYATRRLRDGLQERFLIGIGLWVLLQSAATAFSRAGIMQSSRYTDLLSIGLIVNFLCLAASFDRNGGQRRVRIGTALFFCCWLGVNAAGLYRQSTGGFLANKKIASAMETKATAGYVRTSVPSFLVPDGRLKIIPYPDGGKLKSFLDDPLIRAVLPAGIRGPVPFRAVAGEPQITAGQEEILPYPPYSWDRLWLVADKPAGFVVTGNGPLHYLQLLAQGNTDGIRALDASGTEQPVVLLNALSNNGWQRLLVHCPGGTCRIEIAPGTTPVTVTDPCETGPASACALILLEKAKYLLIIGSGIFIIGIFLALKSRTVSGVGSE
jgi:hypothetical protein